ncbi:MFS transporter [Caldisericum exile]|nr:MFS transporter [Caldisericum exile]
MNYVIFRNRDFLLYVIGQVLSELGNGLYLIAITWLLSEVTGSKGIAVGGALSIYAIGDIISGFFSGPIADNLDKKRLLMIVDSLRASIILFLYVLYVRRSLNTLSISVILLFLSLVTPFFSAGEFTLFPLIVEREDLLQANGFITGIRKFIGVISPAVGAVIISAFGYSACFLLDVFSFLFSVTTIILIKYRSNEKSQLQNIMKIQRIYQTIGDGFKFIKNSPLLFRFSFFTLLINLVTAPFELFLLLFLSRDNFGVNAYGLILSSISFGVLFFGFLTGIIPKRYSSLQLLLYGLILMGISTIFLGIFKALPLIIIVSFFIGFGNALTNIPLSTFLQQTIPNDKLGIVSSFIYTMASLGAPVSLSLGGFLSDKIAPQILIIATGFLVLFLVIFGFIFLKTENS